MSNKASSDLPMQDPVAFFLTWPTYGSWLPGDERGWTEFHRGWKMPSQDLERLCQSKMSEEQCLLTYTERQIVIAQVLETCSHRGWTCFAVDCRSNHAHLVIGAENTDPKKIRIDVKAWCTRRLKEKSDPRRTNWWAERGSIRWVWNDASLQNVIKYVTDAQGRKDRDES